MAIRIAHEAPKKLFEYVQSQTDYDYCLINLYEEDQEYAELFNEAVKSGREVILDNSIFELGTAFDRSKYKAGIEKLNPTWYIIPDVLEDAEGTWNSLEDWFTDYTPTGVNSKTIGVVQGKTVYDALECFRRMSIDPRVDMVAISFDYSFYELLVAHPNKLVSWMLGRIAFLGHIVKHFPHILNKPIHLLGCALPQEGQYYRDYEFLYSMDTSNPVVHAIKDIKYSEIGLLSKDSQKLFELVNFQEPVEPLLLEYNLRKFKAFWKG